MSKLTKDEIAGLNIAFDRLLQGVGVNAGTFKEFLTQGQGQLEISSPLTLYVETTGNDSWEGTPLRPFKTIQAAIDWLKPYTIKAAVTVQVGVGTFDGFVIEGIEVQNKDSTGGSLVKFEVSGTMVPFTPLTGTASGTVASATVGSDRASHVTITDAGQNWTVDELIGAHLFVAGAGSDYYVIVSNTATTICCTSTSATGMATTAYSVVKPGTIILPTAKYATPDGIGETTTVTGSILHKGSYNSGAYASPPVLVRNLELKTTTSSALIYSFSGSFEVRYCNISTTSTISIVRNRGDRLSLRYCSISKTGAGNSTLIDSSSGKNLSVVRCLILGNSTTTGISMSGTESTSGIFQGTIRGCTIGVRSASAFFYFNANSLWIENCTTAILLSEIGQAVLVGLGGTGNTTGISISKGAKARMSSSTTITATNEIVLDGVNYTLADMRAASPKLLTNTYGTIVYE